MKRFVVVILFFSVLCLGGAWAAYYQEVSPAVPAMRPVSSLSGYVPAGALLYLQSKDFSSLLADWKASPQKRQWLQSDNYEMFSRSRLFLRLHEASGQFAAAAGLPPDMNFLGQVAGSQSALALYDIGKLQFLFITRRASGSFLQSELWQTRSKFQARSAGGTTFYIRRDLQSEREVAFAVSGDYLLLATREDLIANALKLMQGGQDRTIESEPWWSDAIAATGPEGDLRMVLNLEKIVPSPYFRSYWIQQNISDLRGYRAAVSDLFRSSQEYREERVLLRKPASVVASSAIDVDAVADLIRLVPVEAGVYEVQASPTADASYRVLETKILDPHIGPGGNGRIAPQVQLTSGEIGNSSDMETRIDQIPGQATYSLDLAAPLKGLLNKAPIRAVLQVQETQGDNDGVFVRIHSAIALLAGSDWSETDVHAALVNVLGPALTAGNLGVNWQAKAGYQELDGLWSLAVAVRGRYVMISDDAELLRSLLANLDQKIVSQPAVFVAGFNHARERQNFQRLAGVLDGAGSSFSNSSDRGRAPELFSGNIASLSSTLSEISSERIVVHDDGDNVTQTVTYRWTQ